MHSSLGSIQMIGGLWVGRKTQRERFLEEDVHDDANRTIKSQREIITAHESSIASLEESGGATVGIIQGYETNIRIIAQKLDIKMHETLTPAGMPTH